MQRNTIHIVTLYDYCGDVTYRHDKGKERPHYHDHLDLCTPLPPQSSSVIFALFVVFFDLRACHIQYHPISFLNITYLILIPY